MLLEILQQNYIGIAVTLLLILFIITNNNFDKNINQLFLAAALCVLLLILVEAWERELALSTTYTWTRTLLSAIGYSLRPLIPLFLVYRVRSITKNMSLLLCIPPALANTVIAFSALCSKLAFSYMSDNQFVREPLGFPPFLTAGFYVLVLLYSPQESAEEDA